MPSGTSAVLRARRLWLCGIVQALALLAGPAVAQAPSGGLDLRETLAGVLAYTRWPQPPEPLRLCLVGASAHAERIVREGLPYAGHTLVLRQLGVDDDVGAQCDALYLGNVGVSDWQRLQPSLAGKPVLTVCERSEVCTAAGMVRLEIDADGRQVRFEVNLDAVARSTVRIHPQVLRLGRRKEPAP